MKDLRGPIMRELTERGGERRYWRYDHEEPDDMAGPWYEECVRHDDEWWCIRQITPHPDGASAYDWQHLEDEHGALTDQPLPEDEPLLKPITAAEFEQAWREAIRRRTET